MQGYFCPAVSFSSPEFLAENRFPRRSTPPTLIRCILSFPGDWTAGCLCMSRIITFSFGPGSVATRPTESDDVETPGSAKTSLAHKTGAGT